MLFETYFYWCGVAANVVIAFFILLFFYLLMKERARQGPDDKTPLF